MMPDILRRARRRLGRDRRVVAPALERPRRAADGGLFGSAVSVALAITAGLAILWLSAPAGEPPPRPNQPPPARIARTGSGSPPAGAAPVLFAVSPRPPARSFAGLAEARVIGITVWAPRYLPVNVSLVAVEWQPDASLLIQPDGPPGGVLRAWYAGTGGREALLLEQGSGIGVHGSNAPPDRRGTLTLADGTRVVWLRGHPVRPAGVRNGLPDPGWDCPCRWEGEEVRAGTDRIGMSGWRLVSDVLTVDELLRVAEGITYLPGSSP